MYLLFRYKNITPSEYYRMGKGEKTVLRAFMEVEIKDRREKDKDMASMFG